MVDIYGKSMMEGRLLQGSKKVERSKVFEELLHDGTL
jgi:hypothetical protein